MAVRAALGASTWALRRMLLAESLLLCGAGAAIGVVISQPLVTILARYASRFSVRALDLTVDFSMLWVGVALAIIAAVILAFVPRLPSANASNGMNLASGSVRITSSTGRRQRAFAVTQIAASFRAARRRMHVDHYADRVAKDPERHRYASRPGH